MFPSIEAPLDAVLGLSVALCCAILILTHVRHELTFDRHHERADRIHKVIRETLLPDGRLEFIETSGPLAETILAIVPEVEAATRLYGHYINVRAMGHQMYSFYVLVDPAFFEMFDYPLVGGGSARRALDRPESILITERAARRYFGEKDPIGETITVWSGYARGDYIVSGVLVDYPQNTSVYPIDFITTHVPDYVSHRLWSSWRPDKRTNRRIQTYVILQGGAEPDVVEAKLQPIAQGNIGSNVAEPTAYRLQALPRMHFDPRSRHSVRERTVYLYAAAAGLILLIGAANFINLATARSSVRAKEVGIRKVSGARRGQLARQFLVEALLLALASTGMAVVVASLIAPKVGEALRQPFELDWEMAPLVFLLASCVGVLAGAYPALHLSRLPVKGAIGASRGVGAVRLRKTLVVSQFAVTAALAIMTLTVARQMDYVANRLHLYNEVRLREIGIRKVLGASVTSLIALLSSEFILLVSIGMVISCPFAFISTGTKRSQVSFRNAIVSSESSPVVRTPRL